MKMRLLDLSRIRCVILDHTKVIRPGGTFSVFVGFSPKQIDFVIMDDKVLSEEEPSCVKFREMLKESKICLLTPEKLGLPGAKNGGHP